MRMRFLRHAATAVVAGALVAGCSSNNYTAPRAVVLPNPTALDYLLLPGGPAQAGGVFANGVLLSWTNANDSRITDYAVFARDSSTQQWAQVGKTTSNTFHDGLTSQAYLVASEDAVGDQSAGDSISVTTTPILPAPDTLNSWPFNHAVELQWTDTPLSSPNASQFAYYRVYSDSATVNGGSVTCSPNFSDLVVEGSSVSDAFIITGLANGDTRCYAVTSVALNGQESALSTFTAQTPDSAAGNFDIVMNPRATVVVVHHPLHNSAPITTSVRGVRPAS